MDRRKLILLFSITLLKLCAGQQGRVLLRDVQALTLRRGDHTTGRRSSPVPQLQCVGGTAKGQFAPKVVQCYNRGFDGVDVQWECKAELPAEFQFGKISVSCEGYDYPNDPYILAGSCGLKYELDYSSQGARKHAYHPPSAPYEDSGTDYTRIFYFVLVAGAIYLLYTWMTNTGDRPGGNGFRGGSGFDHGPGHPPGGGPPPYGWNPPPSYDDTFGKGTSQGGASHAAPGAGRAAGSGPGFWSGVGLGALGGYLWGNTG
ncbi:7 transmembrane protein 66 [Aphelenchoides avenae]|nr:7 transmembrane protein 66 [Aphelenchus avenae]